jgi:hypothetical protein
MSAVIIRKTIGMWSKRLNMKMKDFVFRAESEEGDHPERTRTSSVDLTKCQCPDGYQSTTVGKVWDEYHGTRHLRFPSFTRRVVTWNCDSYPVAYVSGVSTIMRGSIVFSFAGREATVGTYMHITERLSRCYQYRLDG